MDYIMLNSYSFLNFIQERIRVSYISLLLLDETVPIAPTYCSLNQSHFFDEILKISKYIYTCCLQMASN